MAQVQKQKVEIETVSLQIGKIVQTVCRRLLEPKKSKRYGKPKQQKTQTIFTFKER